MLFCCKWTHPTVCTVYCVQWTVPGGSRLQDVVGELCEISAWKAGGIFYYRFYQILNKGATSSHRKIIFSMLGWDDQLYPAYEMRDQIYHHHVGWDDQLYPAHEMRDQMYHHHVGWNDQLYPAHEMRDQLYPPHVHRGEMINCMLMLVEKVSCILLIMGRRKAVTSSSWEEGQLYPPHDRKTVSCILLM